MPERRAGEGSTLPLRPSQTCPGHPAAQPDLVPLAKKLAQLVDDLAPFDDPHDRLAFIVDRAKRIPPLPVNERTDANRVRGCVSVVWLVGEVREGNCTFRFDGDSPVVRGLLALLCEFFSGIPPADIAASDIDPLDALGLLDSLSPTRRNGLTSARARIREFARTHVSERECGQVAQP